MDAETARRPISRFRRIEKKFWMTARQYEALFPLLEEHMTRDAYGTSTVCNVYYDTPDYMLIRRSIERPRFKEKLRVRSYGVPKDTDSVFVEIKRKLNGVGYKRRIYIPYRDVKTLLRGEPIGCGDAQIERELLEFVNRYRPQPRVFIAYERFAMYDREEPDVRVTIDTSLRYRTENVDMTFGDGGEPVMGDGSRVLMEIKAPNAIPIWLTGAMSELRIYQAPFSKIGTCFTEHIAPAMRSSRAEDKNTAERNV